MTKKNDRTSRVPASRTAGLLRRLALTAPGCWIAATALVAPAAVGGPDGRPEVALVIAASGDARVVHRSGRVARLRAGEPVCEGEAVITGDDGCLQLRFMDGAIAWVHPETEFAVEEFRYGGAVERSFLSLAHGAVRMVTGAIGKRRHDDYRLRTPTATVGIRGTDFELIETSRGPAAARARERRGLTVVVHQGRVVVSNEAASAEVDQGGSLRVRDASATPMPGGPLATRRWPYRSRRRGAAARKKADAANGTLDARLADLALAR